MKAVVLVGGEGTRLRPLTSTTPKPLMPLMGRAFLHHVIDHLSAHGVDEVILSSPYLESGFVHFIEQRRGDPRIVWISETAPLGTGGAVLNAIEHFDDSFLVLNGDILTDLDLTAMAAAHDASGSAVSIATMHVDDARPFGLVVTDETGRVIEFREKPAELIPGYINAGTYIINPAALSGFERGVSISIEKAVFPAIIERGEAVRAFPSQCYWMDLGTPEKYLLAHFDILEGKVKGESYPAPYIEGAHVDLQAHLGRWVVAGDGSSIGPDAVIEDSVIHEGAVVGQGASLRGCILGRNSVVGAGARLERCVLGEGAVVAEGAQMMDGRVPED